LTSLFETIANVIDRQRAMVETHYGPGRMLLVIQKLQKEADIQSAIILDSMIDARQLRRKVSYHCMESK
jgi:conserved oligomeric Golgi complex subunit 4